MLTLDWVFQVLPGFGHEGILERGKVFLGLEVAHLRRDLGQVTVTARFPPRQVLRCLARPPWSFYTGLAVCEPSATPVLDAHTHLGAALRPRHEKVPH
jgi:hypothetical protein